MPHLSPISWLILPLLFWSLYFMFAINYIYTSQLNLKMVFKSKSTSTSKSWLWSSI